MTGAGVVTVADLLNRNAPVRARVDDGEDIGRGISVGSLLRREGRPPHAIERPVQPRAHQQAEEGDEPATDRRALVRRGAIGAGALIAAGSVFGAAVLTQVGPTAGTDAQDQPVTGPYPGQGILDQDNPLAPPVGTVQLNEAANVNPLDPGTPAPSSWVNVAFPSALAAVPTGTAAAAASDAAASQTGGGGSVGSTPGSSTVTGGSGGSTGSTSTPPTSSSSGSGGDAGGGTTQQGPVGDVGKGLGGAANDVGDTVGGPVGDTVSGLGDTVNKTTDTLDGTVNNLLSGSDDNRSSRSSSSSSSSGDSSSSSAPRNEDKSDDGGSGTSSGKSSGGLLGTVGDLAGGLLG